MSTNHVSQSNQSNQSKAIYLCERVNDVESSWGRLASVSLSEVETGGAVNEETVVKACWDDAALHVRFDCVDTHVVSSFVNRNDPIYEQDVVEVFIDESGMGMNYIEIEVSPNNVLFEANITCKHRNLPREINVDLNEGEQWLTTNVEANEQRRVYTLSIPYHIFSEPPTVGTEWRVNLYRIDESKEGVKEYQAWSPTGYVDYHVPGRFGTFRFVQR